MSKSLRCSILLFAAIGSGCFQEFRTPSAFESEAFLCGTAELDELVEDCRARYEDGEPCGGVVSLQGRPQATDVVSTIELTTTSFRLDASSGAQLLDQAEGTGASPYFLLSLKMKTIGGEAPDEPVDMSRVLTIDPSSGSAPEPLADDLLDIGLRISNGAESVEVAGLDETGTVTLTRQGERELAGTFEGSFGEVDDFVEGCFHLLALDVRFTQ